MPDSNSTRTCPKCGGSKFQKVSGRCCGCAKALKVAWTLKNAEHIDQYRKKNRERDRAKEAEHRRNHPEKIAAAKEKYLSVNKQRYDAQRKAYYERNLELCKARSRKSFADNKEQRYKGCAEWAKANPEKIKNMRDKGRAKLISTPLGKMRCLLRARVGRIFRINGYTKKSRTHEILGCDYEFFVKHIESQFTEGMTWEKMGSQIHIDHKIPIASAKSEEELLKLNHYTNLRPLWAEDNMKKGARLDYHL